MPNYHATPEGRVQFTADEETQWAAEHAASLAGAFDRKAADVRTQRNQKLSACDWRMLTDSPVNAAFKIYRQALRDVPQQPGFPDNVIWPAEP